MSKNVAVFVDVANIFYAAKAAGVDIDYVTLLKSATAGRDLVRAYAYTGLDPENDNQRNFHEFLQRSGYKVVSKDIRKYGDGRIKANLDIELVVDLMRLAQHLDIAVVISGDGDFAPAIKAVQQMGVRVEVISFRGNTSSDLIEVADDFYDITQLARVEKGARSGRRVAAEDDLSMTAVPEKETGTTARVAGVARSRRDGRTRAASGAAASPRAARRSRAASAGRPVAAPARRRPAGQRDRAAGRAPVAVAPSVVRPSGLEDARSARGGAEARGRTASERRWRGRRAPRAAWPWPWSRSRPRRGGAEGEAAEGGRRRGGAGERAGGRRPGGRRRRGGVPRGGAAHAAPALDLRVRVGHPDRHAQAARRRAAARRGRRGLRGRAGDPRVPAGGAPPAGRRRPGRPAVAGRAPRGGRRLPVGHRPRALRGGGAAGYARGPGRRHARNRGGGRWPARRRRPAYRPRQRQVQQRPRSEVRAGGPGAAPRRAGASRPGGARRWRSASVGAPWLIQAGRDAPCRTRPAPGPAAPADTDAPAGEAAPRRSTRRSRPLRASLPRSRPRGRRTEPAAPADADAPAGKAAPQALDPAQAGRRERACPAVGSGSRTRARPAGGHGRAGRQGRTQALDPAQAGRCERARRRAGSRVRGRRRARCGEATEPSSPHARRPHPSPPGLRPAP